MKKKFSRGVVMVDGKSVLRPGQIDILELLYKYRFGSRQLLAESLGIKAGSSLHERLGVLVKHGLIGMKLEKHLKLVGVPAAYFITPKGLKALQALPEHEYITDSVIKAAYKDKTTSQSFIMDTLGAYKYTNVLKRQYLALKVFTKRDMSRYDYFPEQLPDAFLSLPTDTQPKRFFLDVIPDNRPRFQIDRRIEQYCTYFEEGGWDVTGSELPALLLIGETGGTERRVRRYVRAQLAKSSMDDITVLTTTYGALNQASNTDIWTDIADSDELVSLADA